MAASARLSAPRPYLPVIGIGKRFVGAPPSILGRLTSFSTASRTALMAEIALDCGYPASSLKERVYPCQARLAAMPIGAAF